MQHMSFFIGAKRGCTNFLPASVAGVTGVRSDSDPGFQSRIRSASLRPFC